MKLVLTSIIVVLCTTLWSQQSNTKNMPNETVKIEIWSDVVCPFCFVGKRKLEQAIKNQNAEDKVEIIWHSFQLDPDFPKDKAYPSAQYLSERKGYPIDQVKAMSNQLAENGKGYGIDFKFDKALTFNTFNAHRLIQWSKTENKSDALKEALMVAYFTNGTNLTEEENLLAVVKSVGLSAEKAKSILASDEYSEEVRMDIYQAHQLNVRGVPYFLINEKTAISGAQADEVFESALKAELSEAKPLIESLGEGVCLPNGECK
jgi:predicted DsbA family dithiol-disulfide isomerase|tara:strand:+ start:5709 stop:6491 length:783 start_codon:yes stop_codon:yes gene_type:complete